MDATLGGWPSGRWSAESLAARPEVRIDLDRSADDINAVAGHERGRTAGTGLPRDPHLQRVQVAGEQPAAPTVSR
jgi:hypothetical protein